MQNRGLGMCHRQRLLLPGFTIAELLVVIGLITTLTALLLPVVGIVRESSRRSVCAANLSQCWKGFELYASTNRGFVPRGHIRGSLQHPEWTALVAKSMGIATPFTWSDVARFAPLHCPSHPTDGVASHFIVNAVSTGTTTDIAGMTQLGSLRYPRRCRGSWRRRRSSAE